MYRLFPTLFHRCYSAGNRKGVPWIMNEQITSIVFLAFLVLVPVGMVAGIIIAIVRRSRQRGGWKSVAQSRGWRWLGSSNSATGQLRAILEPTLFALRKGRHLISDVVLGTDSGTEFWLARYRYNSGTAYGRRRQAGIYGLTVFPRTTDGPEFWLQHRLSESPGFIGGAIASKLESLAEKIPASGMVASPDPNWSWSLVSSAENLAKMGFPAGAADSLKSETQPGDFVFFLRGYVMVARTGDPESSWAEEAPALMRRIQAILTP